MPMRTPVLSAANTHRLLRILVPERGTPEQILAGLEEHLGHPPTNLNLRAWLENALSRRDPTCDPVAICEAAIAADARERKRARLQAYRAARSAERKHARELQAFVRRMGL